jgi:phytoene desaturase
MAVTDERARPARADRPAGPARPGGSGSDVAVVIGAGLGGLAAAVRLRAMGWRVVVLEALDQPGGRARVFRRDGFTFDAGPTVVTAPHLVAELFELVGRDARDYFSLVAVDPFYRILFDDGSTFDYVGDEERLLAEIGRLAPGDVDGYRRLARLAERIFDTGFTQLADQPFHRLSDMLRVVPAMVRLQSWRSVHGLVARHIRDPRLRQALTFEPLLVGGDPFRTSSIYLLIHWLERKWGVHFALGGTTSIIGALVRLLGELDVEVRLDTPADEIEIEHGRAVAVRTAAGERIPCALVVANADPSSVYTRLVAPAHRRRHTDRAVGRVRQSMSLFVGYFGTRRTYPELAHHTIVLGPRYRGLLDDVFRRRVLADDFSLYLHAPTRTDPSLAPPGGETFYVLSPVPNTRGGIDWAREAEPYFARIRRSLERRLLPGLEDALATSFTMTPADFEHTLRSVDGAAFGPEPLLTQSAWFRYHNRSPDVAGLYFVGAGTHPGGGIPGVLCSAKVLERVAPRPARPDVTRP